MGTDLVDSLARALRPGADEEGLDRARNLLREAFTDYGPANLNELYMAVRAVTSGRGVDLVSVLRVLAEQDPNQALSEFVKHGSDADGAPPSDAETL